MRLLALLSLIAAAGGAAQAATTFTIDPAQSTVTLSGTTVGGAPLTQQGPGSLTTRIGGTIDADVTATSVAIAGGTVDAQENGSWRPGAGGGPGNAPADFGAQATAFFGTIIGALRNIQMTVTSPAQPLVNNSFDASSLVFMFPTNSTAVLDYTAGILGPGSVALAGESTNRTATVATLSGAAGSRTLTIAIDTTFVFTVASDNDTSLTIRGQLVAREGSGNPNPEGPRITSIRLVGNQVQITATGTTAAAQLQSSTNLTAWSAKQATVTSPDANTRVFTVPVTGPREFYRLAQ